MGSASLGLFAGSAAFAGEAMVGGVAAVGSAPTCAIASVDATAISTVQKMNHRLIMLTFADNAWKACVLDPKARASPAAWWPVPAPAARARALHHAQFPAAWKPPPAVPRSSLPPFQRWKETPKSPTSAFSAAIPPPARPLHPHH